MRLLASNGFIGQHMKVPPVPGHQASPLAGSVGELLPIRTLDVPDLDRTHSITPLPAKPFGDPW
jgi:hypothetical protein